jgi:uncharacterized damage-inducible protein DinB
MTWTVPDITRIEGSLVADEPTMLADYIDWHRTTLLLKCAGLTADQLAERPVPPSTLSLLGLVRHMTDVERSWFRRRFRGERVDLLYRRDDHPAAAFDEVDPGRAEADHAAFVAEWDLSRNAMAGANLDDTFINGHGQTMSLRCLLLHMIEEYARHNGHADLLRQRIDGATGE